MKLEYNDSSNIDRGYLLVAEPMMVDKQFMRTVILLCDDSQEGAIGLIINRQTDVMVSAALDLKSTIENTLFIGGPVSPERLHYIHTFPQIKESIPLQDGIYLGGSFEEIQEKALSGVLNEQNCRFFSGYCGWSSGQLAGEIEKHTWIILPSPLNLLFDIKPQNLWKEILKHKGGKYKIFSNYPPNPIFN